LLSGTGNITRAKQHGNQSRLSRHLVWPQGQLTAVGHPSGRIRVALSRQQIAAQLPSMGVVRGLRQQGIHLAQGGCDVAARSKQARLQEQRGDMAWDMAWELLQDRLQLCRRLLCRTQGRVRRSQRGLQIGSRFALKRPIGLEPIGDLTQLPERQHRACNGRPHLCIGRFECGLFEFDQGLCRQTLIEPGLARQQARLAQIGGQLQGCLQIDYCGQALPRP